MELVIDLLYVFDLFCIQHINLTSEHLAMTSTILTLIVCFFL